MTELTFGSALARLWPHGDRHVPGLVAATIAAAPTVFAKYGLTSNLVIAHAMAQFSHECGAGDEMVENLNYRAEQLLRQWPRHFTPAQASTMAHNPRAIANQAYNGRMGNRIGTDDGWNFRGRGAAQTTGRDAYTKLGAQLGLDLVGRPELVIAPEHFLQCGVADFIACGCLPFAERDELFGVTQHLNGGQIGATQRAHWLAQWKAALAI
jgi:putative chitinase